MRKLGTVKIYQCVYNRDYYSWIASQMNLYQRVLYSVKLLPQELLPKDIGGGGNLSRASNSVVPF